MPESWKIIDIKYVGTHPRRGFQSQNALDDTNDEFDPNDFRQRPSGENPRLPFGLD